MFLNFLFVFPIKWFCCNYDLRFDLFRVVLNYSGATQVSIHGGIACGGVG